MAPPPIRPFDVARCILHEMLQLEKFLDYVAITKNVPMAHRVSRISVIKKEKLVGLLHCGLFRALGLRTVSHSMHICCYASARVWKVQCTKFAGAFLVHRRNLLTSSCNLQANEVAVGSCSLPGRRKKNEDAFSITELSSGGKVFAVFDGHRGSFAARFLRDTLPMVIDKRLLSQSKLNCVSSEAETDNEGHDSLCRKEILEAAFDICQEHLRVRIEKNRQGNLVGTTALLALMTEASTFFLAQAGDSKAVLCRNGEALSLTDDHTPMNDEEASRIIAMNGWIDWESRMFPLVNGQLQMTRSLGDLHLKQYGVISKPTVKRIELNAETDSFLVLCSDGITHTVCDDEIVHIVSQYECPKKAAETLACSAQQYGSTDDVTCLVIPLMGWGKNKTPTKQDFSHFRMVLGIRGDG